jgi:hypothetical protein
MFGMHIVENLLKKCIQKKKSKKIFCTFLQTFCRFFSTSNTQMGEIRVAI